MVADPLDNVLVLVDLSKRRYTTRRRRRPGSNIGRARAGLSLTGARALASRWVACAWKAWCE